MSAGPWFVIATTVRIRHEMLVLLWDGTYGDAASRGIRIFQSYDVAAERAATETDGVWTHVVVDQDGLDKLLIEQGLVL